jgi:hypothetical protein
VIPRAFLSAILLLPACGEDHAAQPTAEQADQLNQAEELLNREAEVDNSSGDAAERE